MTTTFNFKKPQRFDKDKAAEGVEHYIEDRNGTYYGTFTMRFFDAHNKIIKTELDTHHRDAKKDPHGKGKSAKLWGFVNVVLTDWSGVKDADGNDVPFSAEAAFAYIVNDDDTDLDSWLFEKLMERCTDERYYAPSLAAEKVSKAKN